MMRRLFLLMIIFALLITACNDKTVETILVEAIVTETYMEDESLLVEGIGENNPLGNASMVDIKGAEIKKLGEILNYSDIKPGYRITLEIQELAESYPTQTKSMKVNILEEAKTDQEEKSEFKDVKFYFIYFDEKDAYLVEETHEIEKVDGIARLTLETLRDITPKTKNATNPIHESTLINNIYMEENIIIVDFSKGIEKNNFGSTGEALEVQAIVNTLTQFPTVDGVTFKVDGNEDIESWLSHIGNVEEPFIKDMSIVKEKVLD